MQTVINYSEAYTIRRGLLFHPLASAVTSTQLQQQVAAVLTVKGHIAATTYQIWLRISTACWISPILYDGPEAVSQNYQFQWCDSHPA